MTRSERDVYAVLAGFFLGLCLWAIIANETVRNIASGIFSLGVLCTVAYIVYSDWGA